MTSTAKQKILIADDEPDILELIEYHLGKEGYQVFTAHDGQEAIQQARRRQPDLIILDMMMPWMDGVDACRHLRSIPELKNTFIIFLTARNEEQAEITAFASGADDYITKPIKPRALTSRINAILRRQSAPPQEVIQNKLTVADLVIDRDSFLVFRDQQEFVFVKKEFELLYFLATHSGKVCTRDSILKNIWGNSVIVTNRTIDVHIRKLREKLGDRYIKTIKGVGYKFESN